MLEKKGLEEVTVIAFELIMVAQGRPLVVRSIDGKEFLLRLPTAEELIRFEKESRDAWGITDNDWRPMTEERAKELSAPIS